MSSITGTLETVITCTPAQPKISQDWAAAAPVPYMAPYLEAILSFIHLFCAAQGPGDRVNDNTDIEIIAQGL